MVARVLSRRSSQSTRRQARRNGAPAHALLWGFLAGKRGNRCHSLDKLQKQLGSRVPERSLVPAFGEHTEGMSFRQELLSGSRENAEMRRTSFGGWGTGCGAGHSQRREFRGKRGAATVLWLLSTLLHLLMGTGVKVTVKRVGGQKSPEHPRR